MFFLLKSKQMVWIYTNNTLIIGLVKEREWKTKSQSIKTRIRTHKINISFLLEIHILWYWRIMSKKYMVINHVSNFLNFEIYQTSSLNKPNHSCERFFLDVKTYTQPIPCYAWSVVQPCRWCQTSYIQYKTPRNDYL